MHGASSRCLFPTFIFNSSNCLVALVMDASHSFARTISMLPNLESTGQWLPSKRREEREIHLKTLVDTAPDRGDLFAVKSIQEIRETLKLRVGPSSGRWLLSSRRRRQVHLRDATKPYTSIWDFFPEEIPIRTLASPPIPRIRVIRRFASESSLCTLDFPSPTENRNSHEISEAPLSTSDTLTSPRPLKATHLLVAFSEKPPDVDITIKSEENSPSPDDDASETPTFPDYIEMPINDLLFILNVPNLSIPDPDSEPHSTVLPPRLPDELPRVLMQVPHMETFPELVIYLHTRNQAALFRELIPEWIRDTLHPLPLASACSVVSSSSPKDVAKPNVSEDVVKTSLIRKLLRWLVHRSRPSSSSKSIRTDCGFSEAGTTLRPDVASSRESRTPSRSATALAIELAEAAEFFELEGDEVLSRTVAVLDALQENLTYIGYFDANLWTELETSLDVLLKAISSRAKVEIV